MANNVSVYPTGIGNAISDSRFRPYLTGVTDFEGALSTILLYTSGDNKNSVDNNIFKTDVDYLNDLSASIQNIYVEETTNEGLSASPNPVNSGSILPGGTIPRFKLDGIHDYYGVFNNFSILSIQESYGGIVKVHTNFGADWNGFFFGDKPAQYTFSGFFLDTPEYPYYQEFMTAYDTVLAGRKVVENKLLTKFMFEGMIVDGYLIDISITNTYDNQYTKNFTFSVLSTGKKWIRNNTIVTKDGGKRIKGLNFMSNVARLTAEGLNEETLAMKQSVNNNLISASDSYETLAPFG